MGLLDFDDTYKPPFTSKRGATDMERDNLDELNNLGRKKVTEDFEDSPHADRKHEPREPLST